MKYLAIFLILIGFCGTASGQYLGDKLPPGTMLPDYDGDYIFPPNYVDFYYSEPRFDHYYVTESVYRYDIPYMISNGTISSMNVNCSDMELTLNIKPSGNKGWVTLVLPRILVDSKTDISNDDDFIVLLDSKEVSRSDIPSEKLRILIIPFYDDTSQINVIGVNYPEHAGENACEKKHEPPFSYLLSPLKQFNSRISINEIQCRNSLQIMLMYDGAPACVKPESIDKLKQRGFSYVPIGASFHIEKDCNNIDGRAEAQCFKDAFESCTFAKTNSVIHTIEGDAMYLESIIKADCRIHTIFDNTGDRYWGPDAGIAKDVCNNVELEEDHVWIIDECASEPEFQINYMGQDWELDKKCREISGTWNNTFHNCVDLPNLDACEENGGNLTCMSYEQMGNGRDVCRNVCNFDANEVDRK